MRSKEEEGESDSDMTVPKKPPLPDQAAPLLSYKGLIQVSRPKSKTRKHKFTSPSEDIKEMQENMPGLDISKLQNILDDLPQIRSESQFSDEFYTPSRAPFRNQFAHRQTSADLTRDKILLQRCDSVPNIQLGETLLEELGIDDAEVVTARSTTALEDPSRTDRSQQAAEERKAVKPQVGSREYAEQDLQRLVAKPVENKEDADEDLPPLLQALTRQAKHDGKKELLKKKLEELEENERQRREAEKVFLREPTCPQPATVSSKMPNKMVVRTSDIRVSERVCLSSMTLTKNATVYNDLIDEIDPSTVKKLDSSLFLGDEITEVYTEIMKTVPTDHLDLENDDLIMPAADSVNLTAAMASASLSRKRSDRVINPDLHHSADPPWGSMDNHDWAKTPLSPPKDIRGNPLVSPMVPAGAGVKGKKSDDPFGDFYGPGAAPKASEEDEPNPMADYMARNYASWLNWWKNTINSDDYMKYLSTQETDYMGVVFHFYNSDDEGDDDDYQYGKAHSRSSKNTAKLLAQQEERDKKLDELRKEKTEYSEGFWNVNTILMGGLGKDPEVEGEDEDSPRKTPSTDALTPAMQQTPRSSRMQMSRRTQRVTNLEDVPEGRLTQSGVMRRGHMSARTGTSRLTGTKASASVLKEEEEDEKEEKVTPQDRLERVWLVLHMPDGHKLDMAIKYSSDQYHSKLEDAIESWEKAADLIIKRETLIGKLETFERHASDPNRFFERGFRGSSVARLDEARTRSGLYKKIDSLEVDLAKLLDKIYNDYQDVVSFKGRPYKDKMAWDRTEMLYWLQEERKRQALEYEARIRTHNMPLKMVHLEPIAPVS